LPRATNDCCRAQDRFGVAPQPCDLDMITLLSPEGCSGDRIDKQFVSEARGLPRLNCPHWRSVFSSVFKEPKLFAHPRPTDGHDLVLLCGRCEPSVERSETLLDSLRRDNP
jgi:hypothetical protein